MKRSAKFALTFFAVVVTGIVLFNLVMPKMGSLPGDGMKRFTAAQMNSFATALDMFKVDNGHYPTGSNALQALVTAPADAKNWHQYLDAIPLDPWQHPYVYECPGKHLTNSYDLFSVGPDGRAGTDDDIVNW